MSVKWIWITNRIKSLAQTFWEYPWRMIKSVHIWRPAIARDYKEFKERTGSLWHL